MVTTEGEGDDLFVSRRGLGSSRLPRTWVTAQDELHESRRWLELPHRQLQASSNGEAHYAAPKPIEYGVYRKGNVSSDIPFQPRESASKIQLNACRALAKQRARF